VHPTEDSDARHVYHQYVVRSDERDRLAEHLRDRGIGTAVLYPVPVHRQPAYAGRVSVGPGGLPVSERLPGRILCLPVWPEMTDRERDLVAGALREF
jgi:dTDP-4-amino-4,6-dideoxygalactose transaminase